MAIQVCQSIDDADTRKRELRGLAEAMQMFSITEGFIISEDEEETIEETGYTIKVIPIWKYLLT